MSKLSRLRLISRGRSKYRIGDWWYKSSNNTLQYATVEYWYEIDLDQKVPCDYWIKHLIQKTERVMPMSCLYDLIELYKQLNYPVDDEKIQKIVDFYSARIKRE